MSQPFSTRIRVRYSDCDPQGVAFFGNYLTFFDIAMTELWREAIGPYDEMVAAGTDSVVAEATLRYLAPARFDDVIELAVTVTRLGTTSITSSIEVWREGDLLCEGTLRHVFVETGGQSKAPIPADVRAGLERFAA